MENANIKELDKNVFSDDMKRKIIAAEEEDRKNGSNDRDFFEFIETVKTKYEL